MLVRGRRQVGKSRLVQEFVQRADVASVFFTATREEPGRELLRFTEALAASDLPVAGSIRQGVRPTSWEAAFDLAATGLQGPVILVLDEFPYLLDDRQRLAATLQAVWDRRLSAGPVLLVVVGSDLSVMESLGAYGSPLYGRPSRELVVEPFGVGEIGEILNLDPTTACDMALVVGGFPLLVRDAAGFDGALPFLHAALEDPTSPLLVTGERILAAEFPPRLQARAVLNAVGSCERGFSSIAQHAGIPRGALSRPLAELVARRVVAVDEPLSVKAPTGRLRRYRVADTYLRFWLRFLAEGLELVHRGRGDLLADQIESTWTSYRGRAVEPLVRAALERSLPRAETGEARLVGSWWTWANDTEVDLVGIGGRGSHRSVELIGSIKWRERAAFGARDLAALHRAAVAVPGASAATPAVAVSRAGVDAEVGLALGPEELFGSNAPGT